MIFLENVSLTLPGPETSLPILYRVNLVVDKGEAISIIGPSGSGKTSLMMVIAGVEQASEGRVVIAGEDITQCDEDQLAAFRRRHVSVVFQNFHLIPTMTALENVAVALKLAEIPEAEPRAREALESVGLGKRLSHYPDQLSGGEQQRVAMARAFVTRPALLLADEPTGNLDSETGHTIIDLLFGLKEKFGTTLVLITHDKTLAARASRSLKMQDGRLIETNAPGEAA
jgi:putative ABC transport system ATP-binding protein